MGTGQSVYVPVKAVVSVLAPEVGGPDTWRALCLPATEATLTRFTAVPVQMVIPHPPSVVLVQVLGRALVSVSDRNSARIGFGVGHTACGTYYDRERKSYTFDISLPGKREDETNSFSCQIIYAVGTVAFFELQPQRQIS